MIRKSLLAAVAVLMAGCHATVAGHAVPAATAPASASPAAGNPFAGMNACAVIDQVMAGEGFPAAAPSAADRFRSCASNKHGDANVGLALQDGEAYDQNLPDRSKAYAGHVGERRAILEREPIGAVGQCSIVMEVKPSSRVLVSLSGNGTTDEACDRVKAIAVKVGKLLPPNT